MDKGEEFINKHIAGELQHNWLGNSLTWRKVTLNIKHQKYKTIQQLLAGSTTRLVAVHQLLTKPLSPLFLAQHAGVVHLAVILTWRSQMCYKECFIWWWLWNRPHVHSLTATGVWSKSPEARQLGWQGAARLSKKGDSGSNRFPLWNFCKSYNEI